VEDLVAGAQVHEHPLVMSLEEFRNQANEWGRAQVPFLFVVDFEKMKPLAWRLDGINSNEVLFDFNGFTNSASAKKTIPSIVSIEPMPFKEYNKRFDMVRNHLERGDSFLANFTIKTKLTLSGTLRDCFLATRAPYRFWLKDSFVVFSPEPFVQIRAKKIYSYPMKGTIDAAVPKAAEQILSNRKEIAEHVTIVDLIRNDLSEVADNVVVTRFRFLQEVKSRERRLLQVSSEIEGVLRHEFLSHIGDLLVRLLPAGSVSGAPKNKTCQIIREAEAESRGYYTGICGYFDGQDLDSGVMIRFIEHTKGEFYYRSGGGITTQSDPGKEFEEALNKIYVPVD
jgi:para-aminobenzoate synthetase component I